MFSLVIFVSIVTVYILGWFISIYVTAYAESDYTRRTEGLHRAYKEDAIFWACIWPAQLVIVLLYFPWSVVNWIGRLLKKYIDLVYDDKDKFTN